MTKEVQYEVLNPWAEIDPVPPRAISPRLHDLKDRTIGLYSFSRKSASLPVLQAVERQLRERFPTAGFRYFAFGKAGGISSGVEKKQFEDWVRGVDAVISAVGD